MPMVECKDGDIHFERNGTGEPMVMLLPQSSGPVGVGPFLNRLGKEFSVIRYDQRGTGRSAPVPTPDGMTMAGRAEEVVALLDALKLDQAILCCHSTGCGIGVATVSVHADRIAGIALISPWSHGDTHLTTMQRLRVAAARGLDPYRYAWFNASLLFPPDYRREHAKGFETIAEAAHTSPQDADQISDRLEAILAFDSRPHLEAVSCPTLVVTGADDQLMPDWFGRELAAGIPHAKLVALTGGGHMLPETRSDDVSNAVCAFFGKGS